MQTGVHVKMYLHSPSEFKIYNMTYSSIETSSLAKGFDTLRLGL